MSEIKSRAHYRDRAAKALQSAAKSGDPEMTSIYLSLAESYFELASLVPAERAEMHVVDGEAGTDQLVESYRVAS